jgi:serine/threonine protein kinase
MPLPAGTELGTHKILTLIGVGGMGEVYRARDTQLDRIVAIKVLPTHLADRSELRERLEREARTVASLTNPIVRLTGKADWHNVKRRGRFAAALFLSSQHR